MKYLLVSLFLFLLPLINAHHLLGSWVTESSDHIPIENHLSDSALRFLETVVDDTASKHCHKVKCEKGLMGYFSHLWALFMDRFE